MKLNFSYDYFTDTLTVEGVRYCGAIFREFGLGPLNRPLEIIKREDGMITVRVLPEVEWQEP